MPNAAQTPNNPNTSTPNVFGGRRNLNAGVKYNNLRSSISILIYGILLIMFYLPADVIDRVINHTNKMLLEGEQRLKKEAAKNNKISAEEVKKISEQVVTVKFFLDEGIRSIGTDNPDLPGGAMIPRNKISQIKGKVMKLITSATIAINRVFPRDVMTILIVALLSSLYYVMMDISKTCYRPPTMINFVKEVATPFVTSTRNKQCADLKLAWNPSILWIKAGIFAVASKMAIGYLTLLTPALEKSGFRPAEIRAVKGALTVPGIGPVEAALTSETENPGTADRPGTSGRPGTSARR